MTTPNWKIEYVRAKIKNHNKILETLRQLRMQGTDTFIRIESLRADLCEFLRLLEANSPEDMED